MNFYKFFIRVSAFVTKEIREVLRQPWLVMSLILGPFAILALFGVGYSGSPTVLRTVIIAPNEPVLLKSIQENAASLGQQLELVHTEPNSPLATQLTNTEEATKPSRQATAQQFINQYQVDVVAGFPPNAAQLIESGQPVPVVLYYDSIDPVRSQYVTSFGLIYTYEVNRRVLASAALEAQGASQNRLAGMRQMEESVQSARTALQAADRARSSEAARNLDQNMDRLSSALEASAGLLMRIESNVGTSGASGAAQALQRVDEMRNSIQTFRGALDGQGVFDTQRRLAELDEIERQARELDRILTRFNAIPPDVLTAPFRSVPVNTAAIAPDFVTFYAPGVLALLIQHLAVTMAALSLVRERLLGSLEVFRVGPLSPFEALLGKYISFMILCMVIAVILLLLLVFGLGVPLQGAIWPPTPPHLAYIGGALLLLIGASLGIGFVISAISTSDSQAVQLSMIILLASIFFSGFFLPLDALSGPARVVEFLLPVTYGIQAFQAAMLRGQEPFALNFVSRLGQFDPTGAPLWMLGLGMIVLFLLSLTLFGRQFKGE